MAGSRECAAQLDILERRGATVKERRCMVEYHIQLSSVSGSDTRALKEIPAANVFATF